MFIYIEIYMLDLMESILFIKLHPILPVILKIFIVISNIKSVEYLFP